MKQFLKIKPKPKRAKPTAISNYKISYLDKRSKTYHRVVMTAFSGVFGAIGLLYVFAASATSGGESFFSNHDNLMYVFIVLASIFLVLIVAYFVIRKK